MTRLCFVSYGLAVAFGGLACVSFAFVVPSLAFLGFAAWGLIAQGRYDKRLDDVLARLIRIENRGR